MSTTTPDNIFRPDPSDPYNLVADWATTTDSIQAALLARGNSYRGTGAQRAAFTTAPQGSIWADTDGDRDIFVRGASDWRALTARGQKTLYTTPGIFLTAVQTVTLSEPITSQPSGIILEWSFYTSGAAADSTWTYTYIPKSALNRVGQTQNYTMSNSTAGLVQKIVRLDSATTLSGHANNGAGASASMVLRSVRAW